jgi:hypothetical protein
MLCRDCALAVLDAAWHMCHALGVSLYMLLACCALALPLFTRLVDGGIPAALRARGFDFDGAYSLLDLARLAAAPGGWDYLLSATFWICAWLLSHLLPTHAFARMRGGCERARAVWGPSAQPEVYRGERVLVCAAGRVWRERRAHSQRNARRVVCAVIVVCPLLRGLTQLLLLLAPMSPSTAQQVHRLSRALSYFYAHEVMIVGVPLLSSTIGPRTWLALNPRTLGCPLIDCSLLVGTLLTQRPMDRDSPPQ